VRTRPTAGAARGAVGGHLTCAQRHRLKPLKAAELHSRQYRGREALLGPKDWEHAEQLSALHLRRSR
jgi:hypothetical protein